MPRPLISTRTMKSLRKLDESAMPSECTVKTRTVLTDEDTGFTEFSPLTVVDGPVPCRLVDRVMQAREAGVYGREGDEPPAYIALPIGTTVADDQYIEVSTPVFGETQIQLFEVEGDPWQADFATSINVNVWRQDERHAY